MAIPATRPRPFSAGKQAMIRCAKEKNNHEIRDLDAVKIIALPLG
jgi:hypothetical protein